MFLVINLVPPLQDMSFIPTVWGQFFKAQFLTLAGKFIKYSFSASIIQIVLTWLFSLSVCHKLRFTKVFLALA